MKSLLILSLIFSCSFLKAQNLTCKDFKIGTFRFVDEMFKNTYITRTDASQKEVDEKLNQEIEGNIEWKSDCSYELTYTKVPANEMLGKKVFVDITRIDGKIATCKCTLDGFSVELKMEKIE